MHGINIFMSLAEKFYQENLNCQASFPSIPDYLKTDLEITEWIFDQNIPYIDLSLKFNVSEWQKELAIAEKYYVPHRESQDHLGWNSCCIHGIDTDKPGIWHRYTDTEPEYKWTSLSKLTPTITQFCKQLPFENFARIRFMQLDAGGWINPHNDTPPNMPEDFKLIDHLVPINIAIDHPNDCYMSLKGTGIVPWSNGCAKIVNITNDHSVINFSKFKRTHLIVHGIIGNKKEEFSRLVANSYKVQYEHSRI